MYKSHDAKLLTVFETLPDSVATALGFMDQSLSFGAVVELDKKRKGGGEQAHR